MKVPITSARRAIAATVAAVLIAAAATACGDNDEASSASGTNYDITIVSGPLADPFFSAMKAGAEQAAKDFDVKVNYTAPKDLSNIGPDLARLGEAALAGKPDGIVFSNFVPDSQNPAIHDAIDSDIPVTFMNAGPDWQEMGGLNYVGEDPEVVGASVGQRFADAGKKDILCINHVPGNPTLELRCAAMDKVVSAAGGTTKVISIPAEQSTDPAAVTAAIAGAINDDDKVDAIFTLGSAVAEAGVRAIDQSGRDIILGTTDLSTNVLKYVKDGSIAFASDQQPYLTGYYAVQILAQYLRTQLHPIGAIDTAPNWITQDNASAVLKANDENDGIRGAK